MCKMLGVVGLTFEWLVEHACSNTQVNFVAILIKFVKKIQEFSNT